MKSSGKTNKKADKEAKEAKKKSDSNKKRRAKDDDSVSEDDDDALDDEDSKTEDARHVANLTKAILRDKNFTSKLLAKATDGLDLSNMKPTKSLSSRKKQKIKSSGNHLSLNSFVKAATKLQFRHTKFTRNECEFRKRVGDRTMDTIELDYLHHHPGETKQEAAKVEAKRDRFFEEWSGVMAGAMNEVRNYRQGRVKDACIEKWMKIHNVPKLFPTEDLIIVMKRDFSEWEPEMDDDGNKVGDGDPDKLAHYHELFDWYIDVMLPSMCGSNDLTPKIRHFEPVSTAKCGENAGDSLVGKLICPPSQEAMALLFFENARRKWEMMYDWKEVQGKKEKFPLYSSKEPTVNPEWKTKYSNSQSGQDPFGGWKKKGIARFNEISRMLKDVRAEPNSIVQEKLACQRLYQKFKDNYNKVNPEKPDDSDDEVDLEEEEMEFDDEE
jgi:hypothetical protein